MFHTHYTDIVQDMTGRHIYSKFYGAANNCVQYSYTFTEEVIYDIAYIAVNHVEVKLKCNVTLFDCM